MSGVSRLRRIFTAKPSTTVTFLYHDDYETPQGLRNVVDTFKKLCENKLFRRKVAIYDYIVRRLAKAKAFPLIEEILESQKQYQEISTEGFVIRLISLYGKAGMFNHAHALFDQMPSFNCPRSEKSFTALLNAFLTANRFDQVPDLFRQLPPQYSIKPDTASYNVVIHAFCEMGSIDSALKMIREMEELGHRPNVITFNTLLGAFYEKRGYAEGEKIWALMRAQEDVRPDVASYKIRMSGLIRDGRVTEAVKVVDEMIVNGVKPDVRCFNVLIKGFCSDGRMEEAKYWYDELVRSKCVADRTTYDTFVPFLIEKGDFDMALKLCEAAMAMGGKLLIDVQVLKQVVEGLIGQGMIGEATKLVGLAKEKNLEIELPLNT
ncbi:Tetratricopeptide-like helical domain superfamily [Sesbania bispinosa]|nr:Tetratricopeptide-like helical domain superfamily [Sesbania bispinosa]